MPNAPLTEHTIARPSEVWLIPRDLLDLFEASPATRHPRGARRSSVRTARPCGTDLLRFEWVMPMAGADITELLVRAARSGNSLVFLSKRPSISAWDDSICNHPDTRGWFFFADRVRLSPMDSVDPGRYRGPSMLIAYGRAAVDHLVHSIQRAAIPGRLMTRGALPEAEVIHG